MPKQRKDLHRPWPTQWPWEARLFAEGWCTSHRAAHAIGISVSSLYSLTRKADDHPTGKTKFKKRQRFVKGQKAVLRVRYWMRNHLVSVADVKRHFRVEVKAPEEFLDEAEGEAV